MQYPLLVEADARQDATMNLRELEVAGNDQVTCGVTAACAAPIRGPRGPLSAPARYQSI